MTATEWRDLFPPHTGALPLYDVISLVNGHLQRTTGSMPTFADAYALVEEAVRDGALAVKEMYALTVLPRA